MLNVPFLKSGASSVQGETRAHSRLGSPIGGLRKRKSSRNMVDENDTERTVEVISKPEHREPSQHSSVTLPLEISESTDSLLNITAHVSSFDTRNKSTVVVENIQILNQPIISSQPTPVEESKHDALKKLNTWKQMKKAGKLTKAEIKADFMKRLRTNVIAMIGQEGRIRQI